MRKLFYLLLIPFCLTGCKKDQSKIDDQAIQKYINDHHLTATAEPNGLYFVSTTAGTGGNPNDTSLVTVLYKGYLTDGTVFAQLTTTPQTFSLSGVIAGWREGIPLMKKGGVATLLIPSALGYGGQVQNGIPANSVLIFDVDLVNFQ